MDATDIEPAQALRRDLAPMIGILGQLFEARMSALLKGHQLTYTQLATLSHLRRSDEAQTVSSLAHAMQINQPGMSKLVRKLEEQQAVTIAESPDDARARLVSITTDGAERLDRVGLELDADVAQWFADWTVDELGQFMGFTGRLLMWLDEHRA